MTKYIESQIDDARRMRAAGALWKEVEDKTGVGRDVIHYHDKKKLKPGHNKITAAELVQAAERVSQGEHLKAVAASYWVSHQLLAYQIKKMKVAEIQHERANRVAE